MKQITKIGIVALIAAMVLATGFVAGMQYQKSQPVKVDVISYSGDNIVNAGTFPVPLEIGSFGMWTNSPFFYERNITSYVVYFH